MSRRTLAIISLVLVMGIWGSAFTVTKLADMPPAILALLRFVLASAILMPLALLRRHRPARSFMGAREWSIVAAMGLCGFTLNQAGSNLALAYTTATQGSLIQSAIPIATAVYNRALSLLDASQTATFINLVPIAGVAIAVIFLGEPILGLQLVGGAVALVGVWLAS